MKVLLLVPIRKLGFAGEVVEVATGYARNFLLPQGKAIIATPEEVQKAADNEEFKKLNREDKERRINDAVAELEGKTLLFTERVTESGKLFGSITDKEILLKIEEEIKLELSKDDVTIEAHIKDLGDHAIVFNFSGNKSINVNVRVQTPEGKTEVEIKEEKKTEETK